MFSQFKGVLVSALPFAVQAHLRAVDHYINGECEIRLVPRVCSRRRVAVDVGANVGAYTYFLRRHSAKVHAYEPNPQLAERLGHLYPDVVVRNAAVSDKGGTLTLRIPVASGRVNHELASVAQTFDDEESVVRFDVPAVTLDAEMLGDVGFLKIDAEQHELAVLRGAMRTISECQPIIMCEVTPLLYDRPLPAMFEPLSALGYEGWFRFEGCYKPFRDFDPEQHANRQQWGKRFMGGNVFFLPSAVNGHQLLGARG